MLITKYYVSSALKNYKAKTLSKLELNPACRQAGTGPIFWLAKLQKNMILHEKNEIIERPKGLFYQFSFMNSANYRKVFLISQLKVFTSNNLAKNELLLY